MLDMISAEVIEKSFRFYFFEKVNVEEVNVAIAKM